VQTQAKEEVKEAEKQEEKEKDRSTLLKRRQEGCPLNLLQRL